MKSDKSFWDFFKSERMRTLLPLIVLGCALLILPSFFKKGEEVISEPDGEARLYEMCSMVEGVGECRVMVTYEGESVYAVAVLCDGAGSVAVRERLVELICSLYGIGANRVAVLELGGEAKK